MTATRQLTWQLTASKTIVTASRKLSKKGWFCWPQLNEVDFSSAAYRFKTCQSTNIFRTLALLWKLVQIIVQVY